MNTSAASSSPFTQDSLISDNRRRSTREVTMTRGLLRAVDPRKGHPTLEVMVIDMSLHGVGLRSPVALDEGEFYHIEIGVGPLHVSSRLRVTRCETRPDGYFDAGCEFC